ncbi:tetratricopeptide repeat protein 19, mitochondrial isoform X2 [Xenopus laevis]|uniref:Tetratricopeptide repeat protein 19, mitochondrial isoform X2 n=1 Tax=Xenopus laevis TaxID=8355 RepID=A0A8J1MC40_XENLA|nr:tetratricopeptide repeat protein 19, mitochondrial isoform X2 [Xenopus laevis]
MLRNTGLCLYRRYLPCVARRYRSDCGQAAARRTSWVVAVSHRPKRMTVAAVCPLPSCLVTSARETVSGGRRNLSFLVGAAAFSLFSYFGKNESEEEVTEAEAEIILLLKKAKSEKLFKETLMYMLNDGVQQNDNAFIEISLKLASIYATQNKKELAVAGYKFCILSLEEKLEKAAGLLEESLTAEEKCNTRLLLGLCLDSYGRYLLNNSSFSQAQDMYEKALKICREEQGTEHPQSIILMNDIAIALEALGNHEEAFAVVKQASELARKTEHPDLHVVLSNLAMILTYQGKEHFAEAERIFKEALEHSEKKGDSASAQYIQDGLAELDRRKKGS